jgi:hypothetical protein
MVSAIRKGETYRSIARRLGCCTYTVRRACRAAGIKPTKRFPRNGAADRARRYFADGLNGWEAAKAMRTRYHNIQRLWALWRDRLIDAGTDRKCGSCQKPLHAGRCLVRRQRRQGEDARLPSPAARADVTLGEIYRYIPTALKREDREDIASEIYIAVLSGEISLSDLADRAGQFIYRQSRISREASSLYFEGEDGDSWMSQIEDPNALAAFDEIEFDRD